MPELYYTDICRLGPESKNHPFSLYREERLSVMTNSRIRNQGIAAERLLEYALRRNAPDFPLPLDILCEEKGRPVLRSSSRQFSLSHSGDLAACALAEHPIGLDVQKLSRYEERLALRCFSDRERQAFFPCGGDDRAFTLLWTLKESYLKMTGAGLHLPMSSFSVSSGEDNSAFSEDASFWYTQVNDYFFALCVPRGFAPYPTVFSAVELL